MCNNVFRDPKVLPCLHTFCLKCIENFGKDKKEGDALECPMCREVCKVPTGGLLKLDTNIFIETLIPTAGPRRGSLDADCHTCMVEKSRRVAATSFCMECQRSMCDPCTSIHGSMTISKTHQVLSPIGDSCIFGGYEKRNPRNDFARSIQQKKLNVIVASAMCSIVRMYCMSNT